jgi:hypothetical protein
MGFLHSFVLWCLLLGSFDAFGTVYHTRVTPERVGLRWLGTIEAGWLAGHTNTPRWCLVQREERALLMSVLKT